MSLTAAWEFACLPKAPQYWRVTATDIRPSLGKDTSSTPKASGLISGIIRSAIRRCTGSGSHGEWLTHCCRFCWLPSGSRSAIGWIDLRRPCSINSRR